MCLPSLEWVLQPPKKFLRNHIYWKANVFFATSTYFSDFGGGQFLPNNCWLIQPDVWHVSWNTTTLTCQFVTRVLTFQFDINVGKTIIIQPIFDGLHHPFMVILGMVYDCFNHITRVSLPKQGHPQTNWLHNFQQCLSLGSRVDLWEAEDPYGPQKKFTGLVLLGKSSPETHQVSPWNIGGLYVYFPWN